jgi:hypothetical protein
MFCGCDGEWVYSGCGFPIGYASGPTLGSYSCTTEPSDGGYDVWEPVDGGYDVWEHWEGGADGMEPSDANPYDAWEFLDGGDDGWEPVDASEPPDSA